MNASEWLADIGAAADELGYGIVRVEFGRIELIAKQDDIRVEIVSRFLSGAFLRERLTVIPHRSSSGNTNEYVREAIS